jgi:RNA polymerase sigma-70 factor, ECF subfamily
VTRPVLDGDPPPAPATEDAAIARERLRATLAAVGALPPDLRVVFVLHQLEGLSYRQVAAVVGVSEDTVRGRLHRARRALLETLRSWS